MNKMIIIPAIAVSAIIMGSALADAKPNKLRKLTDEQKVQIILAEMQNTAQNDLSEVFINSFPKSFKEGEKKENNHEWMKNNAKVIFNTYKPTKNKHTAEETINKNIININSLGPTQSLSISYSRIVKKNYMLEIGLGFFGYYVGAKYNHWFNLQEPKISAYFGSLFSYCTYFTVVKSYEITIPALEGPTNQIYLPFGIQFLGEGGFSLALETAKVIYLEEKGDEYFRIIPTLKIGYHF